MRNFVFAAVAALGTIALPAFAEQASLSSALPSTLDGWERHGFVQDDFKGLFGDIDASLAGPVVQDEVDGKKVTKRRGQRVQDGTEDVSAETRSYFPVAHVLAGYLTSTGGKAATTRRGVRGTADVGQDVPAVVYQRGEETVAVMTSKTAPRISDDHAEIQVASQSGDVDTDGAFLIVDGVTFVVVSTPEMAPTQTLVGQVAPNANIVVAAQADAETIRAVLGQIDFAALKEIAATKTVTTSETKTARRGKR